MQISNYETISKKLLKSMQSLISEIDTIQIGSKQIFPYGWRKAAKGRTVWRIIEEAIVQNLEYSPEKYNLESVKPPESEVGIFDLELQYPNFKKKIYINIKSAVLGGRANKDDISKANGLIDFLKYHPDDLIFIVTIELKFTKDMQVNLSNVYVMPTGWLPDIYVNPSNNGNLQSSKYKDISLAIKRTNKEFLQALASAKKIADQKRINKIKT